MPLLLAHERTAEKSRLDEDAFAEDLRPEALLETFVAALMYGCNTLSNALKFLALRSIS